MNDYLHSEHTIPATGTAEIDHIAIAVSNLDAAVTWFTEKLGFSMTERRITQGTKSGMVSAVLQAGNLTFVLLQGTSDNSQITKYIEEYGQGVQHIAIRVNDVERVVADLMKKGVAFDTNVIRGNGLIQAFTKRDPLSGLMFEFIHRTDVYEKGFENDNVQSLFEQLEEKDSF